MTPAPQPPADRDALSPADPPGGVPAAGLFLPSPATRPIDDDLYLLTEPYHVCLPGHVLDIRTGYIFDGASIPRPLWPSCGSPMSGDLQAPALIHDALYSAELLPRATCDEIFHKCLRLNGVGRYRAWKMWVGVRIGGGFVWSRHTPEGIARAREYCHLFPAIATNGGF